MERNDFLYENASEQTDLLEKEADRVIKASEDAITSCENEEQKLRLKKEKTSFYQIMEDIFIKKMKDNIKQIDINQIEYEKKMIKDVDDFCFIRDEYLEYLTMIEFNLEIENENHIENENYSDLINNIMKVYDNIIDFCENEELKLELDNKKMDFCERGINILKKRAEKYFFYIISNKLYKHAVYLIDYNYYNNDVVIPTYNEMIDSFQDKRKKLQLGMRKISWYKRTINYCIKIIEKMDLDKENRDIQININQRFKFFYTIKLECISALSYQKKLSNELNELKILNKNVKDHKLEIFSDKLKMNEILFNLRIVDCRNEIVGSKMELYTTPNQYKNEYNEISKCYKTILDICQNMPEKYYNESMKYYNEGSKIQAFKSGEKDMITDREKICKYMLAGWQYILSADCVEKVGKIGKFNRIEGEIYEKIIELKNKGEPSINESIKQHHTYYEEDYKKHKSNLSKMSNLSNHFFLQFVIMLKSIQNTHKK